jgi:hypothetical protein
MRTAIGAEEFLRAWERGDGHASYQRMLAMLEMSPPLPRSPETLTVGARDGALLALRRRLFGDRFLSVTRCGACQETIELTFDADDVTAAAGSAEGEQTLTIEQCSVTFRLPNVADLAAAERTGDLARGRGELLRRCVSRAARDGEELDPASLPPDVVSAIGERMAGADPQADVALDLTCPACGNSWREPFDVASFLWMEIQSAARHLLGDVHAIAATYGWSERSILAMSPARRNAYLEMVR